MRDYAVLNPINYDLSAPNDQIWAQIIKSPRPNTPGYIQARMIFSGGEVRDIKVSRRHVDFPPEKVKSHMFLKVYRGSRGNPYVAVPGSLTSSLGVRQKIKAEYRRRVVARSDHMSNLYTKVATVTGVPRSDVRRVLLAAYFIGEGLKISTK